MASVLHLRRGYFINLLKRFCNYRLSLRLINTMSVSSKVSSASWGQGTYLALANHPSIDGVTIEIPYCVDILLHLPFLHPLFSY